LEGERELVTVRIGGTVTSLARVAGEPEDGLVELSLVPAAGSGVPPGTPIDIGRTSSDGTHWRAAVVTDAPARDRHGFVAKLQGDAVSVEQRRFPRAGVDMPATVVQHEDEQWPATVVDVSLGGARLVTDWRPGKGDLAIVTIGLSGAEPIRFAARVRRLEEDGVTVRYELFPAGARERLIETAFREASTLAA
jgi:hypothetical protein